jgi:sulfoxide reductase heme-binding subunit YedZ
VTTDQIWIIARSTGTAALVALVLSILSGMALRSGALAWLSHNRGVRAVHDLTSILWLPLVVVHVITLMLDPYAKIGVIDLFIPFLVSYGSFAIGLGTISLQLIAVVLIATWLRSRLTQQGWLAIHRLSYVAFGGPSRTACLRARTSRSPCSARSRGSPRRCSRSWRSAA